MTDDVSRQVRAAGPVLFAYDGSELAALAIAEAGELLRTERDALVVCVWQPYDVGFMPVEGERFDAKQTTEVKRAAQRAAAHGAELAEAAGFRASTLEIESAGLNRQLSKPADFERFAGRDVKIVSTLQIGGAKTHRGRLDGVRGANVILTSGGTELPIPLAVIKSANLEYDVRADLQRAKQREKKR